MTPAYEDALASVYLGDGLEVLRELPGESVAALVTDPPAGINFMGKTWDTDHGGRQGWTAAMAASFGECLRVLKPGAHGLVWALPRTSHWTATALEDAGFEVRDVVTHHFGSGFPKSKNLDGDWQGWGTALKPASEHWILVRKPLSERNVAANVLKHGTGALNIDATRIAHNGENPAGERRQGAYSGQPGVDGRDDGKIISRVTEQRYRAQRAGESFGRWPANLILSHAEGCRPVGTRTVESDGHYTGGRGADGAIETGLREGTGEDRYVGTETVEAWECVEGCPVAELDRQSGETGGAAPASGPALTGASTSVARGVFAGTDEPPAFYGDRGGASRFFYVAKPASSERNAGLHGFEERPILWSSGTQNPGSFQSPNTKREKRNFHPTVKAIELMDWLIRLVTPPGGVVLDPFAGSGSTLVAAKLAGFHCIGIEREPDYVEIIRRRLDWAVHEPSLFGDAV